MDPKGINIPALLQGQAFNIRIEKKTESLVRPVQDTKESKMASLSDEARPMWASAFSLPITEEDAQTIAKMLKKELENFSDIEVDWKFNKDAGVLVVQVKDKKTGRVLREIPPEEIVEMLGGQANQGLILDKRA